ncbi:hypothetical protein ACIPRD_07720 [Streptomyces sp. NPDC090108]|uniref:hypothetical protein n=1 Tax=Streptomyces sp. NPDC090108 TaxID=3365947 RepID=UPI003818EFA0
MVESLRRCRDIVALSAALAGCSEALLLAGSMSYGRFFSVRQQRPGLRPSDVDVVVVVRDRDELPSAVSRLASVDFLEVVGYPSTAELERAVGAAGEGRAVDLMVVTSRKPQGDRMCADWGSPGRYDVSAHICSVADLRRLVLPFGAGAEDVAMTVRALPVTARGAGKLRDERWTSLSGSSVSREVRRIRTGELHADLRTPFRSGSDGMYLGRFVRSLLPRLEVLHSSPAVIAVLRECADQLNAMLGVVGGRGPLSPHESLHPHRRDFSPYVRNVCRGAPGFSVTASEVVTRRMPRQASGREVPCGPPPVPRSGVLDGTESGGG